MSFCSVLWLLDCFPCSSSPFQHCFSVSLTPPFWRDYPKKNDYFQEAWRKYPHKPESHQQSLSNIKNLLSNITFSLTIINQGHGKYSLATSVWTLFDFFCPWDIIWWNIYWITNRIKKQMKWSIDSD